MGELRNTQVTAYLTAAERDQLQRLAVGQRITLSTLVGKILAQWLAGQGRGEDDVERIPDR